jgi:4-amino-4-deoxy-L-arabinose transferase-like glycosyltransferase
LSNVSQMQFVAAIWLLFLLRGLFYTTGTPIWEGMDEIASVAQMEAVTSGSMLLKHPQSISADVARSLQVAPLARSVAEGRKNAITHDEFWRLPPDERTEREERLQAIGTEPPLRGSPDGALAAANDPPLYYWLMTPLYAGLRAAPLLDRVFILRIAGVLLASLSIPLAFAIAKRLLGDSAAAVCAIAALSGVPQLMFAISHAGTEPLALLAATAIVFAVMRADNWRGALLAGLLLGLGLLTKVHFLALALVCGIMLLHRWRAALVTLATAAVVGGWWYVWVGIAGGVGSIAGFLQALTGVDWLRAADFGWNTHLWVGNASLLTLRSWVYSIMLLVFLIAGFGLSRQRCPASRPFVVLLAFQAGAFLVVAWQTVTIFNDTGQTIAPGWYVSFLAPIEMALLVYGFRILSPSSAGVPASVFAALDFYGCHVVMMPYYAGLIAYSETGRLAAFPLVRWSYGVFERLSVNKPSWIGTPLVAGLWAAYVVCTCSLLVMAVRLARQRPNPRLESSEVTVDVCRSAE